MASDPLLTFDRFRLDPSSGQLHGESGPIALTPKALSLLEYLASRPGRLIKKDELLDALWPGTFVADGALKVCIREIRRALGDDAQAPRFIETAHRRGYRFIAGVTQSQLTAAAARPAPAADPVGVTPGPVQYARSGDVNIAYQVCGSGPVDLVFVMGWVSHLEYFWKEPSFARFLRRLAAFSRLILFDRRGSGMSDGIAGATPLEEQIDDVQAVVDASGCRQPVVLTYLEGCGLAVHGSTCRDHEVGEGDKALRVHGMLRYEHGRQLERAHVLALLSGAWQHDGLHVGIAADVRQDLREQRVRLAVIERDVGRRADDHEDAAGIEAETRRQAGVGLEVGQVVLLLQARILEQLVGPDAVAAQSLGRDRVRHDHPPGGTAADVVLKRRELVVEHVHGGDLQPARSEGEVVRSVREREVELLPAAELAHRPGAGQKR